jgi:hypothetical protein
LLGEGTVVAVAGILEAEVVVDLDQGLMVPELFEELILIDSRAEEPSGGAADGVTGGAGREFLKLNPSRLGVGVEPTGEGVVGEELVGAGPPDEGEGLDGLFGTEGVVLGPKGMGESNESFA